MMDLFIHFQKMLTLNGNMVFHKLKKKKELMKEELVLYYGDMLIKCHKQNYIKSENNLIELIFIINSFI